MKKTNFTTIIMAIMLTIFTVGCSQSQTTPEQSDSQQAVQEVDSNKENDVLILYFSANNSKDVDAISQATPMIDGASSVEWMANIIHENVGGDLVPIIPSVDYPLEYNELADYAKEEADNDQRPSFEDLGVDPTTYKTIFIGYPIWWYTVPKILETFFDTYDLSGSRIIPFNTHAGSRESGTFNLIREREPNAVVLDGFTVAGNDTGNQNTEENIIEWLNDLNLE